MRRADFSYPLPQELIAQRPLPVRTASRLLALDGADGSLHDLMFTDLPGLLRPADLLVLNDTRVLPARLHGRKSTGGACEILLERILGPRRILVQARASKGLKPGGALSLPAGATATVTARHGELYELELDRDGLSYFETYGSMPLPPYIAREAGDADRERYQTVYADSPGAVAAPTAGLHFDTLMLERLAAAGIRIARLTLHVGAGTFQPIRTDELAAHHMHTERFRVPPETVAAIEVTRRCGGRVVAVGTTVVRALETSAAATGGALATIEGETSIFIVPGHRFRAVDALLTNFHLPESTLLVLVAAFAGRERVLAAYHHAIAGRYRFFSYGDAMFVLPDPASLAPRGARG
jgi:S-adenosylmethionine:tRNA ribosyltransferase-isomerase